MGVDQFALRSRLFDPANARLAEVIQGGHMSKESLIAAFTALLNELPGQPPDEKDLLPWAQRLTDAWCDELLGGEHIDPVKALGSPMKLTTRRQAISMSGIRFSLVCPHHLTLAIGEASISYQPRHHVAGPSGLVRLIDAVTRRRILQEEAVELIADTLEQVLQPQHLEVSLSTEQTCVSCRGVRRQGTEFVTSVRRGLSSAT